MPRLTTLAKFAAVLAAAASIAALVQLRHLLTNQEMIMAQFDGLDADITELKQGVAAAAQRVEDAVDRLLDDTADQEQIEEARGEVREAITALKAIAPVPTDPEQPVDPDAPAPGFDPDAQPAEDNQPA